MNRRNFLKNGSMAGIALSTISLASCANISKPETFPLNSNTTVNDFELDELDIETLQQKMKDGAYTSESITMLYLKRIEEIDRKGAKLNAIIELNPDAIAIAKAMDTERKQGKIRGALHGIPVLIKDNIDTADKMKTTAGSMALANNTAAKDAFIVSLLREAGAVILGKTNLSEWANFRSSHSSSGWSSRGGQTKNPYVLSHNPLGSSAGSGAAVAASLCTVAVGTETDGSIVCPSSVNGLVGIKPTVGLISRAGIIPISKTQDTAGPMARTVTDAAILLSVLAAKDPADTASQDNTDTVIDYTKSLNKAGLQGKRIGVKKGAQSSNESINELFSKAKKDIEALGGILVEVELAEKIAPLAAAEFELLKFEFKSCLNDYLSKATVNVRSLKDIIVFNNTNKEKVMPYFNQELMDASELMAGLDSTAYQEAYTKSHLGAKLVIDTLINEHKLDAFAGITFGPAHATDLIYGDKTGDVYFASPAAMAGYPHITLPCGMVHGLPVGISFMAGAYTEAQLIAMAYAYEQAVKARQKPGFKVAIQS